MKLGAVDLGEGSGHALDGTRGLEPDDELALALRATRVWSYSEPLQEREDARVVAAHRGLKRHVGSARIGCELALRGRGPDTMA